MRSLRAIWVWTADGPAERKYKQKHGKARKNKENQGKIVFVAARSGQGLPGASSYDEKSWYLRIQGRMQFFRFFIVFRVFECLIGNLF